MIVDRPVLLVGSVVRLGVIGIGRQVVRGNDRSLRGAGAGIGSDPPVLRGLADDGPKDFHEQGRYGAAYRRQAWDNGGFSFTIAVR